MGSFLLRVPACGPAPDVAFSQETCGCDALTPRYELCGELCLLGYPTKALVLVLAAPASGARAHTHTQGPC